MTHTIDKSFDDTRSIEIDAFVRKIIDEIRQEEGSGHIIREGSRLASGGPLSEGLGYPVEIAFASGEVITVDIAYTGLVDMHGTREVKEWLINAGRASAEDDAEELYESLDTAERVDIVREIEEMWLDDAIEAGGYIKYAVEKALDRRSELAERAQYILEHIVSIAEDYETPDVKVLISDVTDLTIYRDEWFSLSHDEREEMVQDAIRIANKRKAA